MTSSLSPEAAAHAAVPFVDLKAAWLELRAELEPALLRVAASGWYLLGEELAAFEREFAAYVGAKHCVGLANGLDALHLALRARGIGPGDEVLVPSNTYIASWLGPTWAGATPVPVEPDPATHLVEADAYAAAITKRTRAILPVHLYGLPVDLAPLRLLAERHGLFLLDDAAQAHGARVAGRRIGALAHATAWSFYPGKNLGAFGDAGGVTTDDNALADRLRVLRNYGQRVKYVNDEPGVNSRLDETHAAVLRVKLRHLDEWNDRRRAIAARYAGALSNLPLVLPVTPADRTHAFHLYVVRHRDRDGLQRRLAEEGIGTLIHYPIPPHRQAAYAGLALPDGSLPIAERLAREVLSLPISPHHTNAQVDQVVDALHRLS